MAECVARGGGGYGWVRMGTEMMVSDRLRAGTGKTEFCAAGKFDRTSLPDYIINGLREIE